MCAALSESDGRRECPHRTVDDRAPCVRAAADSTPAGMVGDLALADPFCVSCERVLVCAPSLLAVHSLR